MVRKLLVSLVLLCFPFFYLGGADPAQAEPPPKVYLDGQRVVFDVDPVIENGRVLVPCRKLGEELGAAVVWDDRTRTVIFYRHGTKVTLRVGDDYAYKNGTAIRLDVPAKIINGRTVVPLRFVAEAMGVKVEWLDRYRAVAVTSKTRLAVYYPKLTDTDIHLVREIHGVPYTVGVARAALQELIGAEVLTPGAQRILPPDTRVLKITIRDGLATVDFSAEVLNANVGASLEELGMKSIVNTLTEFPTIQRVMFTVEGQLDDRTMDWWGHVGLYGQPFERDLSPVKEPAVWITSPAPGGLVTSPLTVRGSARLFEGLVCGRLLDDSGQVLAVTKASAGDTARGDFGLRLSFSRPATEVLKLEVSGLDAADGRERHAAVVPLNYGDW